jgi:tetratricopeptide (TPR) repeat protein
MDETYELRVPAGFHLTVWTNPRDGAPADESDAAGQHIYRWRHMDLHPTVGAEAEAAKKSEEKRLRTADEELDATKGKLPSFAWTTFADWAAVGAWYRGLVADRTNPDTAIRAKVADLVSGKTSDLEKAQAVYNFVSSRIRYVGVDFGIGRYQPHTAAEVFANQYGDCKDKHVLLASMLSVLNLHSDPVLVGAGIRFDAAVPSPASFNHVITRLSIDGKDVWLDSTAETGIWGALLKGIRDQDALLAPASPAAAIVHTPAELPYPQTSVEEVSGALDNNLTSESKITFTLRDDDELYLRSALRNVSPSDYGAFMQQMMGGMGFGGTTSAPEIDHLEDPSQPLVLSFHYHRVKEKDWGENRITAIFQPISLPYFTPDKPPISTILLGSPRTERSSVMMQLPDGWSAQLPEPVRARAAFATCDVTYSLFKDHMLSAQRSLTVLESKVSVKQYQQYQTWYDDCGASGVPYIQLFPTPIVGAAVTLPAPEKLYAPAGSSSPAKPSDSRAADMVQQAREKLISFDLDTARQLLDQAAAINPTQANLWTGYAGIEHQLGIETEMLKDMERELSYHPEETQYYAGVAQDELITRDEKTAMATLRAWVKAAPESPDAALALSRHLLDLKSFADALNTARTAIYKLASSDIDLTNLKIVAAKAQFGLGQASQAANSVAPLLKTATDPVQIDDIARILGEGSAFLPDAEAAEAKVLADSEAATADWTMTGNLKAIARQQAQLFAEWDTMALLLFHQGKFTQALGYARAAVYASATDAHDHLADINAVLHNPAATATLRADDQKLRTFALGPANGRQGVVPVTLLLADGMVIDSIPEQSASHGTPLPDPAKYLKIADLHALFPPGSKAHLIRPGFVNCHSGVCELLLAPSK